MEGRQAVFVGGRALVFVKNLLQKLHHIINLVGLPHLNLRKGNFDRTVTAREDQMKRAKSSSRMAISRNSPSTAFMFDLVLLRWGSRECVWKKTHPGPFSFTSSSLASSTVIDLLMASRASLWTQKHSSLARVFSRMEDSECKGSTCLQNNRILIDV